MALAKEPLTTSTPPATPSVSAETVPVRAIEISTSWPEPTAKVVAAPSPMVTSSVVASRAVAETPPMAVRPRETLVAEAVAEVVSTAFTTTSSPASSREPSPIVTSMSRSTFISATAPVPEIRANPPASAVTFEGSAVAASVASAFTVTSPPEVSVT